MNDPLYAGPPICSGKHYTNPEYLLISCDFSVSAINHMLHVAKTKGFGEALGVEFVEDWKDYSIPEWSMIFEKGTVVSRGIR